jgi:hypothetical protein
MPKCIGTGRALTQILFKGGYVGPRANLDGFWRTPDLPTPSESLYWLLNFWVAGRNFVLDRTKLPSSDSEKGNVLTRNMISWSFVQILNMFYYVLCAFCVCKLVFLPMVGQLLVGNCFLILKASRSHLDTPRSVGLPMTSDQLDKGTSTWQHTAFTKDRHPCSGCVQTRKSSSGRP